MLEHFIPQKEPPPLNPLLHHGEADGTVIHSESEDQVIWDGEGEREQEMNKGTSIFLKIALGSQASLRKQTSSQQFCLGN